MIATVPLRQVATIYSGGTPSKAEPSYWRGDIPWVSPKDMGPDIIGDAEDHISADAVNGSATRVVPEQSILVVVRSGILVRRLPVAITSRPVAFNQDIKALVVDARRCLPEYIFWLLKSREGDVLSHGVKKGATVHSLSAGYIEGVAVPMLPLEEQRRIVDILDHAASIRRLREQAQAKVREIIPALFVDMFGDPATNPKGWPETTMGALMATKPNYGTMVKPSADPNGGAWLDIRVANIQDDKLDLTDKKFVELPKKDIERHSVMDGDLLMARAIGSRDHLGKCVVANPGNGRWAFDSHLMRVRYSRHKALPIFIKTMLETPGGRGLFMKNIRQSAVQFNINVGEFSSIVFPVPPLFHQKGFSERAEEVLSLVSLADAATQGAERLAQSLMSQVFGQAAA
ncbi:MAG: restriction endonuclease subunit S [Rhodospirillaceae bacterium]